MRPPKVDDIDILDSLVNVFRSNGYDGTSLAELAKSTGLKKASLYHRFPNGKEEMANAVLNHIEQWVEENIIQTLMDETKTPTQRLYSGLEEIKISYDGGKANCIFRALSLGQGLELFNTQIKKGMNRWIFAFEQLGLAFGLSEAEAQKNAINVLIKIQGSLVVAKAMSDETMFTTTLNEIKATYLEI